MTTITAAEMREALGIGKRSTAAFNAYRKRYPHAFIVVQLGRAGKGGATLFSRKYFDEWMKARKQYLGK